MQHEGLLKLIIKGKNHGLRPRPSTNNEGANMWLVCTNGKDSGQEWKITANRF